MLKSGILLLVAGVIASASTIAAIGPAGSLAPGDMFWVDLYVTGASDLWAYQANLSFDHSVMQFTGTTENGAFLPELDLLLATPIYDTAYDPSFDDQLFAIA